MIGDLDSAFAVLDSYYFDRGRFAPSVRRIFGPLTRRDSHFLFMPMTAALRSDRRFEALVREIGLEDYWRTSRTIPDYRRRSG